MKRYFIRVTFYIIEILFLENIIRRFAFFNSEQPDYYFLTVFVSIILLLLLLYISEYLLKKYVIMFKYEKKEIWTITYSLILVSAYYMLRTPHAEMNFLSNKPFEFDFFLFCSILSMTSFILSFIINIVFLKHKNK